ncbi:MAG: cytochrome c oxidase subunit II, partial [Dehalococcoidia bacterium]|nr:cytochrome c oxidase subunit II [Dehalococcoidia bacterium]
LAISLVTMVYCVVVFRQRPGDTEDGPAMKGNPPLEVIWTIIPLAIVMGLAVYGAIVLNDITRASPDEMEVKIVAAQWSWQFEYPQYGITTSDLHLPVNRPILFRFNSVDVIHNFWVPEFRVMQDMVPGMETTLRITPDREGVYKLECNQLCGLLHAYMTAPVTVEAQSNFDDWAEGQKKQ